MLQTGDDIRRRAVLVRHIRYEGNDRDKAHEMYTEDAILEFPQSGERFVGRDERPPVPCASRAAVRGPRR